MATYLLVITPKPIADQDYEKAFLNLIGCNPAYEDIDWNGINTFFKVSVGNFWASMIQMKDQAVRDDQMLTVVWAFDPFDHLKDRDHLVYKQLRQEIHDYVDDWANELGSKRAVGSYYDGHVCWVLENANTTLLTEDFARSLCSHFQVVSTKSQE
jgi:hypothetical protein